jgi:8-oxo-dGTP pyrophosphatase MutT (NUDIX family)
MKGAAMKNVAYLMNIDIDSISDDSDFVNPPPKRNRDPEEEVHNIPWQPPRQAATHADGEAAAKKTQKILLLFSTIHDTKG